MILSRDLFKNDFSVKQRFRKVFNSRPNDIGLSAYGARNPAVLTNKPSRALVGWEAKLYRQESTVQIGVVRRETSKPPMRKCGSVRVGLGVKMDGDGGSTRCASTLKMTQTLRSTRRF